MKKCLIVDLDGSLIKINTFTAYVLFIVKRALSSRDIKILFQVCYLIFIRKIRLISHTEFKKNILKKTYRFCNNTRIDQFYSEIRSNINKGVVGVINQYRSSGYFCCLATAAPEIYSKLFADEFQFDVLISTLDPCSSKVEWKENIRENKRNNVLRYCQEQNLVPDLFITDHYDDLPLIIEVRNVLLVNPSIKTKTILNANNISFKEYRS